MENETRLIVHDTSVEPSVASQGRSNIAPGASEVHGGETSMQRRRRLSIGDLRLDCAAVSEQPRHNWQEAIAPKFDIGACLGCGSLAKVYRAVRRTDGCEVALKITDARDDEAHAMARNEFQIVSSINNPYLLRALDFICTPTNAIVVMELFLGVELHVAVAREPAKCFSEEAARRIFRQLLEAIACLHKHRVVHRDIKPENVLVSTDALHCRLIDFNTARRLTQGLPLSPIGTRAYMPPEAQWGEPPSEASDVWGVGVCLHLMISGCLFDWQKTCRPGDPYTVQLNGVVASDSCKAVLRLVLAERMMRPASLTLLKMAWTKGEYHDSSSGVSHVKAASAEDLVSLGLVSASPFENLRCSSDSCLVGAGADSVDSADLEHESQFSRRESCEGVLSSSTVPAVEVDSSSESEFNSESGANKSERMATACEFAMTFESDSFSQDGQPLGK